MFFKFRHKTWLFLFRSALVNLGSYRSLNRLHFAYIQLANVFVLILGQGLHSVHT